MSVLLGAIGDDITGPTDLALMLGKNGMPAIQYVTVYQRAAGIHTRSGHTGLGRVGTGGEIPSHQAGGKINVRHTLENDDLWWYMGVAVSAGWIDADQGT